MSEKKDSLNSGEPIQQFIAVDMVADLLESCAPHQRALVSVLAVAERHNIDPLPLIISLAEEMPLNDRRRASDLANNIYAGADPVAALDQIPNLLPPETVLAIKLAGTEGNRSAFYEAWLDRFPGNQIASTDLSDETVPVLVRLLMRVFVVIAVLVLIMLKIVPEFREMFEEFGIELPLVTQLFISICDKILTLWFLPTMLVLCLIPVFFREIRQYLHRWSPLKWQQPVFSAAVVRRRSLALTAKTGNSFKSSIPMILQNASLSRIFPRLGNANDRIEAGQNQWKSLAAERLISSREAEALLLTTSGDTQAWLLRWSAGDHQNRRSTRRSIWLRCCVITIDVILGALVILTCLGIYMSYLHIISQLN